MSDIFGHMPTAWCSGWDLAWDVFGYRIYTRRSSCRPGVEVLVTDNRPWRSPEWSLIPGMVRGMLPARGDGVILVETAPSHIKLCHLGRDYVVSVRGAQHWVSRWRRGLRRLRRERAHMLLCEKLPDAPELVALVSEFL